MKLKDTLTRPKGTFPRRANLPSWEGKMAEGWDEKGIYNKLLKEHENKTPFYLHDGPPYANGQIHCGHALNKIIKDIIIRSKNLEGYYVPYTPGWDTHGLPIENQVTKSGVDRKTTPPALFRQKCREYAIGQVEYQKKQRLRLGVIGDYHHPYRTLDRDYEADQIHIFAKRARDGLIYKGLKPVNWSWSSESALAEAEIEYKDVHATTLYFKFPVEDGKGLLNKGDAILVWTTTAWTIPSNQGLCLNPKRVYGLFKTDKGNLVRLKDLAQSLKEKVGFKERELLKEFTGKDAEGILVRHPYQDRLVPCCADDYVTSDSGTGIVHLGPGHGADDYRVAKKYHLPIVCTVDPKGYRVDSGDEVNGRFYEDAGNKVLGILKENGNLLATEEIVHAYPHDWRTKKPTIFRATTQWFCSITKIKDKLLEEADKVKYLPVWGKTRFKNRLSDRDDWCISRQRLWGVPIPIFYGEDGEPLRDKVLFDYIEKLFRENGSDIWYEWPIEKLRPEGYKTIHSPNGIFTKEKDIRDVWFDSGSSFLASDINYHHPFPADLYFEGNDQYRGWYNSSMILSVAYTGISPYKRILTHGFIVDQNGDKFSKSKQNGIDPVDICNKFGADILRLWTTSIDFTTAEIKLSAPLLSVVSDQYRKIRNTFKFRLSNLQNDDNGDKFDTSYVPSSLSLTSRRILNRLKEVLKDRKKGYDEYNFTNVTTALTNFCVNDLSSFFLDFSKDTLYCDGKNSQQRLETQYVLFTIVRNLAIAYSPILAFTREEVYQTLSFSGKKESVILEDYPSFDDIDEKLSKDYSTLLAIRSKVNTRIEPLRKDNQIHSSSEASVSFAPETEEEKKLIEALGETEVARILIVSGFKRGEKNSVVSHPGIRCDRCWNYFDEVTTDNEGNHLCPRCEKIVHPEGK